MVDTPTINQGTVIDKPFNVAEDIAKKEEGLTEEQKCRAKGWTWDAATNTCIPPLEKKAEEELQPTPTINTQTGELTQEIAGQQPVDKKVVFNPDGTVSVTRAGQTVNLTKEEYNVAELGKGGKVTENVSKLRSLSPEVQSQIQGQELAGQVGQFGQTAIQTTGFNVQEGLITGVVDAIPNALKLAGGAAVAGGTLGLATGGTLSVPLAAIGAAATFVGSMASSIISNFKGQRRDTTKAQQRVLDEGKQTMNDWVTMAEADPVNKAKYLAEYNKVAAQIDAAYRQMKLDTSRDVGKFETALPNLAEFEAFYSAGGEYDVLKNDMRNALVGAGINTDYKTMELARRYSK